MTKVTFDQRSGKSTEYYTRYKINRCPRQHCRSYNIQFSGKVHVGSYSLYENCICLECDTRFQQWFKPIFIEQIILQDNFNFPQKRKKKHATS